MQVALETFLPSVLRNETLIHVFIMAAGLSPLAFLAHLPLIFFILLCTVAKLTQ